MEKDDVHAYNAMPPSLQHAPREAQWHGGAARQPLCGSLLHAAMILGPIGLSYVIESACRKMPGRDALRRFVDMGIFSS